MAKLKYQDPPNSGKWYSMAPSQKEFDDLKVQFDSTERQTTTLSTGVTVVSGETNALADVEIGGRTLTSFGNSNLEANRKYVLADKKTRVIVDGKTIDGVGKFAKGSTIKTTVDFAGKISGSTVENPHNFRVGASNTLLPPSSFANDVDQTRINSVMSINEQSASNNNISNTYMIQQLFSFNVIEAVERNIGRIPTETVADKVAWLKANVVRISCNWHGFGSSVGGSKSTLKAWGTSSWIGSVVGLTSTVAKSSLALAISNIQSDGFVHYLAYAEPSDGATPSVINTDYVSLDIELNPTAQLLTRPTIIRVANFEWKVSGSTVRYPHKAYFAKSKI